MKYFLIIVIAFLCLLSVGVSQVDAVNSPQCLLQDQSQMDTCDNVNTEILGFSIPTLGNVLTFLLRGMLIASGLAGFFFLLTGALMYQRGDAESKDLALLRIRASVIGILLTVTVFALVWTLEQVVLKRRVCLGLSCPIILQSVLSTTDSLDCCVCRISSGPKAGQVGEVINRYEQTCTEDGIGVDLKTAVRDAQIQKIVDDMTLLRGQLLTWKSSFSGDFPHENVFKNVIGYTNQDAPCHDDPLFSEILKHNYVNRNMASYMPSPPQDPWGVGYVYDNDRDGAKAGTNTGVNIFLQWCNQERDRYMDLAADIDRVIDGGDGYNRGSFRWDDPPSGTGYYILRVSTF